MAIFKRQEEKPPDHKTVVYFSPDTVKLAMHKSINATPCEKPTIDGLAQTFRSKIAANLIVCVFDDAFAWEQK